jgi:hypothetical protein
MDMRDLVEGTSFTFGVYFRRIALVRRLTRRTRNGEINLTAIETAFKS